MIHHHSHACRKSQKFSSHLATCVTSKIPKWEQCLTPCRRLNLVWSYPRLVFLSVLLAVTLFVAGPQMGSVDDDQDGVPDVAVVVSAPKASDVCRNFHGIQDGTQASTAVANNQVHSVQLGGFESSTAPHNGGSVLQIVCVLRC